MRADRNMRETREMRLVSKLLKARSVDHSLGHFLARRRTPGPDWKPWEEIGYDLREAIGESFTRESPRRWAIHLCIPIDSRPEDGGVLLSRYLHRVLKDAGVDLKQSPPN